MLKIIFSLFLASTALSESFLQSDEWTNHWFQAVTYAKANEFAKAIDEYSKAISTLNKNNIRDHLYLYNERGLTYLSNGYFNKADYENALKDFNVVLNSPTATQDEKTNALWGRSRAYLLQGRHKEFCSDIKTLEKIEPTYVIEYEQTDDYLTFKMGNRLRYDKSVEDAFIQMLKIKHFINSDDDVVFTSSGMGIIKKSKSPDAPKNPFAEEK